MNEFISTRNAKLSTKIIEGLKSRNMEGYYAATREEALDIALKLIPEGSTVTMGGGMSVHEIGLADALKKIPAVIRGAAVFVLAVIGWTVFSSSNLSQALTRVSHMCGIGCPWALDHTARYHLSSGGILLLIAIGGATPLPAMLGNRLMKHDNMMIHVASVIYFALLLAGCTVCMVSGTYSSFLYAQF